MKPDRRINRFTALSVLGLCLLPGASSAHRQDTVRTLLPVNWSRSRTIDIKHIAIDLRFDWSKRQAYGTTAITLAPLHTTDKIALDAAFLTIHGITLLDGTPLKFAYDGSDKNDALVVMLDKALPEGEDLTVEIDYHTQWSNKTDPGSLAGSNGKGIRFFEPTATEPKKRQQIWSMGDPESNRYWFPGYDAPNDFRTTEFTATVENKFAVISNGNLMQIKPNPDGTRTFHWKMDVPYSNFLTSFVVGEYVDVEQAVDGIKLHNFSNPDEVEATAATVERLPDMVRFFSDATGLKYPYPAYTQVFVQEIPWGMSGISVSTQTENMVDDRRTHADFLYLWDGLEGESLAQQWFGNALTCRDWSQVWLNKGFARYFSNLYDEYRNGREEYLLYQHFTFDHGTYFSDWNSGIRQPLVNRNYENAAAFSASNYPYFHGASVLHMLRKQLGDEKWWKTIRHYVRSNVNRPVTTEDLRLAIEETTGEPMDWFFDQWVYRIGHPVFEVTKNYDHEKKELTLIIRQAQKVDPKEAYPQVEFFQGSMEVEVDGKIERIWLSPKENNTFTFPCTEKPKLLNVDYESSWVKEIKFEKSQDELLYQLQNDKDVLGKNWAIGKLVELAQNEKTSAQDKARIYEGFRNTILGHSYWRLRVVALSQLRSLLTTTAKPAHLDPPTLALLTTIIKNEKSWLRASAINFLGMTQDPKFAGVYLRALSDSSDRVINAAAIALGKSKSPKAFDALARLPRKPSWKNQSLISALYGLKELRDPRGYDIAIKALSDLHSPHWVLATPVWDYRLAAAETIVTLRKSDAAYPFVLTGFRKAMEENDIHGIFYNALLIATLADPRGQEAYDLLRAKFKDDALTMVVIDQYETQFKEAIKKQGI